MAGQCELGARNPARGGRGPCALNGANGPLCDPPCCTARRRCLLRMDLQNGGLRISPSRSRGEG
eukprot:1884046-Alexandrium_andersonii.AAC.1